MNLTSEQLDILRHTQHHAVGKRYCGDSPAMQALVALGLMRSLGKVSWCPDEYFTITTGGVEALRGGVS